MPVTRSWQRTRIIAARGPGRRRIFRPPWLLAASVLVAAGLWQVYTAKTWTFAQSESRLARGELLNLNTVTASDQLRPFLQIAPEREDDTFSYLLSHRPLRNVGALARTHLLPLSRLKPLFVVRTPGEFRREFLRWTAIYFGAFWLVWLIWRLRGFEGDPGILPALHLLTGFGLVLMVSLRDPLRDTLEFSKFAWGTAAGCLLLLLPLFRFWAPRRISNWCYTPLFVAIGLTAMLLRFGYGPGGSDSKVNLGPLQPMEFIKILLVLFLAGYFARYWERLRDLGRLANILPVLCAVAVALTMFFVLKDLGPALVVFFVFLAMFSVAHSRPWLAILGIALMVGGVAVGYHYGKPPTVVGRINMWLSPWDNDVHGGDQLAHALWAFSTGGVRGSGAGWGDPAMIPAGHTDLVLPAIGEEWGFTGVVAVGLLFGFLVWRALRLALRARDDYSVLLSTGLAALIGCEMLLITAGVTGALPLSGVASPFLSSGNTAMLANFLVFAIVLARPGADEAEPGKPFARPARWVGATLGACALVLLGFAGYYQVLHDREYLARQTRVLAEDGVKRALRNPRINSIAREIPRGSILDRNGILLATSDWSELERHRPEYTALGVDVDRACSRLDSRHYPFGALTMHLTGDLRTGENFHATNSSLVEHDSDTRLRGYTWDELPALVRDRHRPGNPGVARLLARDRTVHMTVDVRFEQRAGEILARRLGAHKGALVVMDAQSGDVLAMASLPEREIDLARYGVYPPGSTFKLVTAIAALRLDPEMRRRTFLCRRLPRWSRGQHGARLEPADPRRRERPPARHP